MNKAIKKISIFLLTLILTFCLFACDSCSDNKVATKVNPFISNGDAVYGSISETVNGTTYKYDVTNTQMYLAMKKDIGSSSLINLIDTYMLKKEKNSDGTSYYEAVTDEDIKAQIDKDVYGDEEAKAELTDDEKEEKVADFLDTMFVSYGIKATSIFDDKINEAYRLSLAEEDYALDVLKAEVKANDEAYAEYLAMTDEEKEAAEDPVTSPYYADSKYKTYYANDNYNEYKAIIVTFTSARLANIALQAIGVKVNDDGVWADATTSAVLTAVEVVNKYIELYEYVYGDAVTIDSDKFAYTESDLSSLNSNILARIQNKMTSYDASSSTNSSDETWYTANPYETSSGSVHAFVLKLGETLVTAFDDLTDEELENVKEKYINDLYEASLTSTYVLTAMTKLRAEYKLVIYDTVIEINYASTASKYSVTFDKTDVQNNTVVASITGKDFTADELYAAMKEVYGLSSLGDLLVQQRLLGNPTYNTYYNLSSKSWADSDMQDTIEAAIKAEKTNFEGGTYTDYGYDTTTSSWQTFIEASYGVNNEDDLMLYFLMDTIATEYTKDLNYIVNYPVDKDGDPTYDSDNNAIFDMTLEDAKASYLWKTLLAAMQTKSDEYFSVEGLHLLICSYESVDSYIAGGTAVDPEDWTDAQKTKANELYAEIIAYLNDSKGTYQARFEKIVEAFKTCPNKAGVYTYKGNAVATTLVSDGGTATINVSLYKSYGLYVKYEDLGSFVNGKMAEALNDAVKAIWDADIAKGDTDTDDKNTSIDESADGIINNITLADNVIITKYGYHVYVNLLSNEPTVAETTTEQVQATDSEGNLLFDGSGAPIMNEVEVKRLIPTLEEVRLYTLNKSSSKLTTKQKSILGTYYSPYATEIIGSYFTYAMRFYQLSLLKDSFTNLGDYSTEDLARYTQLYIDYTYEQYLTSVTQDFLE